MPVARVIKPGEYISERKKLDEQSETYGRQVPGWEEIERLEHGVIFDEGEREFELWHHFDFEFEQNNKFLVRPNRENFKPWHFYNEKGGAVEHYYHYWQIHQVHAIQKHYPIFSRYHWILESQ